MQLHIEYNSALYSENLIKNFAACYENVLRQLMTKTFISEIELLDDEQKNLLDTFNNTENDYDKNQTIVSLFEMAAKNFADNTAIIFKDKKISYRELDKKSTDNCRVYFAKKYFGRRCRIHFNSTL